MTTERFRTNPTRTREPIVAVLTGLTTEQREALDTLRADVRALPRERRRALVETLDNLEAVSVMTTKAVTRKKAAKRTRKKAAKPRARRKSPEPDPVHPTIANDPHLASLTLAEISASYDVSVRTLQRYIDAGELVARKIGRAYRVTVADLRTWLDSRATNGG